MLVRDLSTPDYTLEALGYDNDYELLGLNWAHAIKQMDAHAARWIANNALRKSQKKTP